MVTGIALLLGGGELACQFCFSRVIFVFQHRFIVLIVFTIALILLRSELARQFVLLHLVSIILVVCLTRFFFGHPLRRQLDPIRGKLTTRRHTNAVRARQLRAIAAGLDTIADGGTVELPTTGYAGELADAVNRASEQLRRRKEIIARRDDARTNWIAGVSHDVRTPLALILGWAEQLEQDTALPAAARQKACGIRTQSEKLRALIEDLNLTSKLQYGAQPLRCRPTQAGPLLRRLAAEFCDSPLAARCTVALEIAPDADKAILDADAALLARAVENLLHNAACHNPGPVQVQLSAVRTGKTLRITIADDGAGYPPAVLHALQTDEAGENTPHILGLHVVEQIIRAHGGTAAFARNAPRGAKAVLVLPVTEDPAAR